MKRLVRVRPCDGACCIEAPRFPRADGQPGCEYGFKGISTSRGGTSSCKLMAGGATMLVGQCPALPHMTAQEAHQWSCVDWPENDPDGDTGGCCLQWVDD